MSDGLPPCSEHSTPVLRRCVKSVVPYLLCACMPLLLSAPPASAGDFELVDGERVVLVGSTFVERDQIYSYLETRLVARYPQQAMTFRNLGWSGDTVFAEARAGFGSAADGFKHLREHIDARDQSLFH